MDVEGKSLTHRKWYPWFVCAMSFIVQFVGLSFHGSFGPLYVTMLREFKEGDTKTAWVASMSFALSLGVSPLTYRIDEKIGQRNSMIIGSSLFGSALLVSSFAENLDVLYGTIGVILAVALSFCQAASMFVLPHYFGKDYALALGIAISGGSIGSFAFSSIKGYIFTRFTYRTGMQILASTSILLFICGLAFKNPQKTPVKKESDKSVADFGERFPQLSRNKAFYVLLAVAFIYHIMHLVAYVHLTRLAGDLGVSDTKAALLPGILALSESVGKISSGRLISYNRNSVLNIYQAAWLGMSISSFLCPLSRGFPGLTLYALGFGFSVGNANGACVPYINHIVGSKQIVRAYSIFLMAISPAVLAGPPIAGWLRETSLTYDVAFYASGSSIGVAAALLFIVKILHRMQQREYNVILATNREEVDDANSACSDEPSLLHNGTLYVTENGKKCKLKDVLNDKQETWSFLRDCNETKRMNQDGTFHIQIEDKNRQKHSDLSTETSI